MGLSECENCEQLTNENCKTKQTNIELMEANAELKDELSRAIAVKEAKHI